EAAFGVPVRCLPASVPAEVFDEDQTAFTGGTQVSALGPGVGQATTLTMPMHHHWVVGVIDAESQAAGDVTVQLAAPQRRTVHNGLGAFAGRRGRYRFRADWTGAVPLVLVAGVTFDTP